MAASIAPRTGATVIVIIVIGVYEGHERVTGWSASPGAPERRGRLDLPVLGRSKVGQSHANYATDVPFRVSTVLSCSKGAVIGEEKRAGR